MRRLNLNDLPWQDFSSPNGHFQGASKELSIALGAARNQPIGAGGHPFDLELGRLPPGKSGCPFHCHAAQWELFIILSGEGIVRHGPDAARRAVRAGDAMMHPPGNAHQLINTGPGELTYFLATDNPPVDYCYYPDSDKWCLRSPPMFFRPQLMDLWQDEEPPPAAPPQPAALLPASAASFAHLDDVPWEEQRSPTGKYHSYYKNLSLALGGRRDLGPWAGGHPFDWQLRRVPAGAAICPLHAHTVQWELFVVELGTATVRTGDGNRTGVGPGDMFIQPPGTAHQILNSGEGDFVVHILADNSPADSTYYPDSEKWMLKPQRKLFRMIETDYFDGEE